MEIRGRIYTYIKPIYTYIQHEEVMMPPKLYSHEYHYSLHNDCVINYCYLKHTKPGPLISM